MRNRHALTRAVVYGCLLFVSLPSIAAGTLPKGLLELDGREAPPLVLDNLDGERWDISEARGRWLFVHFWASWCGPCRKEMPTIQAIFPQLDASQLEIVLINTAETEDTVFSFLAEVAPDITPLMDTDGLVTEQWQPRGLPATFFVDPEGRLQYLALGGRPWDTPEYLEFVQRLVRQ
ncbi:MAG: TlpA disulfide reductase family protein [Gammaproteobacteria bacterium]